ncbi:hypothetical protein T492DRAFT_401164 [Pavlovales sp. CCMP2436]|nr:hypothetical protein T492DRAFT_401164 [Pavlovales sp. CCMP2436]
MAGAGDEGLDEELDRLEGMPNDSPIEARRVMSALRDLMSSWKPPSESVLGFCECEQALELCARGGGVLLLEMILDKESEPDSDQVYNQAILREDAHTLSEGVLPPYLAWVVARDDRVADLYLDEEEHESSSARLASALLAGLEQALEGSVAIFVVGLFGYEVDGKLYMGAVARASFYEPPPAGVSARLFALTAAQSQFLKAYSHRALDALHGAEEVEAAMVYDMFRSQRADHMQYAVCCPDDNSCARAQGAVRLAHLQHTLVCTHPRDGFSVQDNPRSLAARQELVARAIRRFRFERVAARDSRARALPRPDGRASASHRRNRRRISAERLRTRVRCDDIEPDRPCSVYRRRNLREWAQRASGRAGTLADAGNGALLYFKKLPDE